MAAVVIATLSFFLTSGSIHTHMLILILIDVQYLHNVVFSIKKGSHGVEITLCQIPTIR